MQGRLLLSLMISGLTLTACSGQALIPQPSPPVGQTASLRPVLASALYKRPLMLQSVDGQVVPVAGVLTSDSGFTVAQVNAGVAVASPIAAPVAVSRPAIAPLYYYGGSDFNQYVIQYAEESQHKAATGSTLLQVYNQDIKPLLSDWDASARMIESRAMINGSDDEYIYLPGKDNEPIRLQPLYVYRFASTPKKETLNVYVLKDEIRVHRMVWGEPTIDIASVRIDSDKALEIARQAFANQNPQPGYPVYPDATDANAQIVKDIPADVRWNLQLNQSSKTQLRYFINFSFQRQVQGTDLPKPIPVPAPELMDAQTGSTTTVSAGQAAVAPAMPANYTQSFYGSAEIDAISGEVKSLNRPVWYGPIAYDAATSGGGSAGIATPALAR